MAKTCRDCEMMSWKVGFENGMAYERCQCRETGLVHEQDHQCDAPEKPRLCQVLGVEVGERFRVRVGDEKPEACGPYFISGSGRFNDRGSFDPADAIEALTEAINHPEKIVRLPRLTPEEVQRCQDFGAKWVSRAKYGELVRLWTDRPEPFGNGWCGGEPVAWSVGKFFPSVQPGQRVKVEAES